MTLAELNTDRLVLRPMAPSDAAGYAELLSDPDTHPFITESGPVPESEIPDRIRSNREASEAGRHLCWSIEADGEFVGYVALHDADGPVAALSYAVRRRWRRRGVAHEALEAICRACLDDATERALVARTHVDSEASVRLLLALGFRDCGTVETQFGPRRHFALDTA